MDFAAIFQSLVDFMRDEPGLGLILLAVVALAGRKAARHWNKRDNYTLKDIKKYPGELMEMGAILLLLLFGLLKFTGVL